MHRVDSASAKAERKIEPALSRELADGRTDFFIRFSAQADLDAASRIEDWDARGAAVVKALRATARTSQAGVIARLQERGLAYESLFITNTVYVRSAGQQVAQTLAALPGVSALESPATVQLEKPVKGKVEAQVDGVEWGVAEIKADQVWSDFGVRGEGIVVGNIDSRCAVRPPGRRGAVPGQHRWRHVRPQLQLVRPRPRSAAARRWSRATTAPTAPTRWARWSATTEPATRSVSRRVRPGSPPRAASPATAASSR